jgi:hypothetical protein
MRFRGGSPVPLAFELAAHPDCIYMRRTHDTYQYCSAVLYAVCSMQITSDRSKQFQSSNPMPEEREDRSEEVSRFYARVEVSLCCMLYRSYNIGRIEA